MEWIFCWREGSMLKYFFAGGCQPYLDFGMKPARCIFVSSPGLYREASEGEIGAAIRTPMNRARSDDLVLSVMWLLQRIKRRYQVFGWVIFWTLWFANMVLNNERGDWCG